MIKLEQISLPIKFTDEIVKAKIAEKLKIKTNNIDKYEILKLSVDERRKPNIKFIASISFLSIFISYLICSQFANTLSNLVSTSSIISSS